MPAVPDDTGVLVIVGGPQYRVGSHRQYVQLSRHLAEQGIASMRFDVRGMGDSPGVQRSFEEIDDESVRHWTHSRSLSRRFVEWRYGGCAEARQLRSCTGGPRATSACKAWYWSTLGCDRRRYLRALE